MSKKNDKFGQNIDPTVAIFKENGEKSLVIGAILSEMDETQMVTAPIIIHEPKFPLILKINRLFLTEKSRESLKNWLENVAESKKTPEEFMLGLQISAILGMISVVSAFLLPSWLVFGLLGLVVTLFFAILSVR